MNTQQTHSENTQTCGDAVLSYEAALALITVGGICLASATGMLIYFIATPTTQLQIDPKLDISTTAAAGILLIAAGTFIGGRRCIMGRINNSSCTKRFFCIRDKERGENTNANSNV